MGFVVPARLQQVREGKQHIDDAADVLERQTSILPSALPAEYARLLKTRKQYVFQLSRE